MIAFLGGLARSAVGAGWASRWAVYPIISLACAVWGFGFTMWTPAFALVPCLTMALGFTRWESAGYMMARYGAAPAVLAVSYLIVTGDYWPLVWAACCTAVGGTYWNMLEKFAPVDRKILGVHIDGARIAEFISGSVIIGGVSLL